MSVSLHSTPSEVQEKKRSSRRVYLFLLIFLLLVGSGSTLLSVIGYQTYSARYHTYMSLAQSGDQHLQTAVTLLESLSKNPLNSTAVSQAQHEFTTSSTDFVQLNDGLKSLPGVLTSIPKYGSKLSAALHLLPLAIETSQAGLIGCNALSLIISRFHDPLSNSSGLTMTDVATLTKDIQQVKGILNLAIGQVNALQPNDLQIDPRVSKIVTAFHKDIPTIQMGLNEAAQFLSVAPTLLGIGKPTNYLIEVLDSTELRPAGGFIGNYGVATVSGGRLTSANITDVYLFDTPFEYSGHSITYPSAYNWFDLAPASWSLRDSNLDADFPTAARYGEQNYAKEGGNVPVQGVIAITPGLIQNLLQVTGPVTVPEYQETVTPQNLIELIHYHQEGGGYQGSDTTLAPDGKSSLKKHFIRLLADQFLAQIHQLPPSAFPKLLQVLANSLHSKDIQIYFNSSDAEKLLQSFRLDGAIQSPMSDSLFVVDANISPNKANQFITNTMNDQVTIDATGNIIHHTTITYAWLADGPVYGASLYRDYVRVYVPPDSKLQTQNGWETRGTSQAFGRKVWAGFFTLSYGQTNTITLTWAESGAVKQDVYGWHYLYLIQRQAGTHWMLHVQIVLPSCASVTNKSSGLNSAGKQKITLGQTLNEDLNAVIDYSC